MYILGNSGTDHTVFCDTQVQPIVCGCHYTIIIVHKIVAVIAVDYYFIVHKMVSESTKKSLHYYYCTQNSTPNLECMEQVWFVSRGEHDGD